MSQIWHTVDAMYTLIFILHTPSQGLINETVITQKINIREEKTFGNRVARVFHSFTTLGDKIPSEIT